VREFKDEEGRPWRLSLTTAAAARVRDLVTVDVTEEQEAEDGTKKSVSVAKPFDLIDIGTISQTLQVLRSQFLKLAEILYAILVAQVEERKLTREQFMDGLRGDSLESAAKALEAELVDFFPQRLRRMVAKLAEKMDEIAGELMATAEAGLDSMTVADLPGMPSTKPQESSESIPESGPSASS
jgi:hypothetical protein